MKTLLAAAAVLTAAAAGAVPAPAQTVTRQYTAPASPPAPAAPEAPPPGALATTREHHAVDAYGNRVDSTSSTYRNDLGVAEDRTTTTTVAPAPPPVTSTTTTTTRTTTVDPN